MYMYNSRKCWYVKFCSDYIFYKKEIPNIKRINIHMKGEE
jgi:hypothetical protein